MKILFGLISLLSLISFTVSCDRSAQREEDIQREKPIRQDDIREKDSFEKSVPIQKEETNPNIEILDVGSDEDSEVQ